MSDTKYRWNYTLTWVVEYVRKDAEVGIDCDGKRINKVIKRGCATREEAEKFAIDYCNQLSAKINALIEVETSSLRIAQE